MVRLYFLILFGLILYFNCFAQKDKDFQPFITLRTNLFSLIEPHAGITMGVGYRWSRRFSATLDPTFIFYNPYEDGHDNNGQPFGIKIRTDIRWHLGLQHVFIAPELHLKHITTKKWTSFGINCIGQQCSYYMNAVYKEIRNEIGGALKMGIEVPLDRRKRWDLEFYGGLGFKVNYYKEKNIPLGGIFMPEPSHTDRIGLGVGESMGVPVLPGFIKFSYRIR